MVVIVLSWKVSWTTENVKLGALELFKDMECLSPSVFVYYQLTPSLPSVYGNYTVEEWK